MLKNIFSVQNLLILMIKAILYHNFKNKRKFITKTHSELYSLEYVQLLKNLICNMETIISINKVHSTFNSSFSTNHFIFNIEMSFTHTKVFIYILCSFCYPPVKYPTNQVLIKETMLTLLHI